MRYTEQLRRREGDVITLANGITAARIAGSLALLFTKPFSSGFAVLYLFCGVTDMMDGTVARRTHTESEAGARLDSAADLIFTGVCLFKLLPVLRLPLWVWIWTAGIAGIRAVNLISGYVLRRQAVLLHTPANKLTGLLLFLTPLALGRIPADLAVIPAGAAAAFAAVQEGHLIRTGKERS